jgi:hypothetical protein
MREVTVPVGWHKYPLYRSQQVVCFPGACNATLHADKTNSPSTKKEQPTSHVFGAKMVCEKSLSSQAVTGGSSLNRQFSVGTCKSMRTYVLPTGLVPGGGFFSIVVQPIYPPGSYLDLELRLTADMKGRILCMGRARTTVLTL